MPGSTIDFDTERNIGIALPGVESAQRPGFPARKVHGRLLACVPANRSAEPGSLVLRVDFDDRAELLAAHPDVYYVTDHYAGYNAVLVRLSRVNSNVLQDLLGMAHKFVPRNTAPRSPAEAPKGRFKEMKQSMIPRDCPPVPSRRSDPFLCRRWFSRCVLETHCVCTALRATVRSERSDDFAVFCFGKRFQGLCGDVAH